MSERVVHVVGTGSFALELIEFAGAAGWTIPALIELQDPARVGTVVHGLPVIAPDAVAGGGVAVIGHGGDRLAPWARLTEHGCAPAPPLGHPAAHVSPSAALGPGSVVGPMVVVGAAARLGAHVLLGRGALVGHHTELGDGVVLNPGANVGGNTRVGAGAIVGMGAAVIDHTTIGTGAVVAAGAVVVRPVEDGARVQGVPARVFQPA
jgi:sugar O-acyltransferase (sialic acid O-acetyltransferase NeuD family)